MYCPYVPSHDYERFSKFDEETFNFIMKKGEEDEDYKRKHPIFPFSIIDYHAFYHLANDSIDKCEEDFVERMNQETAKGKFTYMKRSIPDTKWNNNYKYYKRTYNDTKH